MISDTLQDAINEQINKELYSAYVYLAMAAYFEDESLSGFASWMYHQSREEVAHAMKLFDFVNERGGRVILDAIDRPEADFESPLAVMKESLEHEKRVTKMIHDLYELSVDEGDYPAQVLLHWFIDEQVEEEDSIGEIVDRMERAGEGGAALLMIDHELGERDTAEHEH